MKKTVKLFSLLLALVMTMTALSACGSKGDTSSKSEASSKVAESSSSTTDESKTDAPETEGAKVDPTAYEDTMDLSVAVMTGYTQSDSRIEKMLEEKYNVNINLVVLPGWSDGQAKISLLMASGEETPDVMWWWSMDNEFLQWKDAGLLTDVSTYMNTYTNMRDYYNTMDPKSLYYATEDDGAVYRIPGDVAEPSCETLWIRQDWLDKLGLEVPTTVEELEAVMQAFTENDPDGNGKKDTYGLGGDGYDFRSFWPWIQSYGDTHYDKFVVDADGNIGYGPAKDNTKKWVADVADLYAKGYITPNITQDTNRDEEMAKGGFGVTYSWITWNNPNDPIMKAFYAANPDAKWAPIEMVTGENKNPQEDPATSGAWAYFGITKNAKDPERIYAIWDDMSSPENYTERVFGIEGTDYTIDDGIYNPIVALGSEENQSQNIGLDLLNNLFNRKDDALIVNTPETTALFENAAKNSRDFAATIVEWKNPASLTAWVESKTDVEDEKNRYLWGVVAGSESVDTWDAYITTLNSLGLENVLTEAQTVYNAEKESLDNYMTNKVNQK
ncbi:extracellular solute-binding protein [Scatolibacter rhodanostii]|uniref:extracellular solute-binding protein n=1 Tax=Scatolibacter rhodanostii TaxID=2014781 RepID=UPI00135671A9|nr:extracellular solute-binding protein [Scatolibacter rhodanostii]